MDITFDPLKRQKTLQERGIDFVDAIEVAARHIISMRKANEREQARFKEQLKEN